MSLEAVYDAIEVAEICNFGVVFTTSGFIREFDLHLLEDDKDFFAVYNPALTIRQDRFKQYPQLREIFVPISQKLDTETLRKLNYPVEVEGESPESVARTWLRNGRLYRVAANCGYRLQEVLPACPGSSFSRTAVARGRALTQQAES